MILGFARVGWMRTATRQTPKIGSSPSATWGRGTDRVCLHVLEILKGLPGLVQPGCIGLQRCAHILRLARITCGLRRLKILGELVHLRPEQGNGVLCTFAGFGIGAAPALGLQFADPVGKFPDPGIKVTHGCPRYVTDFGELGQESTKGALGGVDIRHPLEVSFCLFQKCDFCPEVLRLRIIRGVLGS